MKVQKLDLFYIFVIVSLLKYMDRFNYFQDNIRMNYYISFQRFIVWMN